MSKRNRLEYFKEYGKKYRAAKRAAKLAIVVDAEAPPLAESHARGRTCRVCDEKVEAKSYWYCHSHNRLSGIEEIGEYQDGTSNGRVLASVTYE